VQDTRKSAGLDVSDRIVLAVLGDSEADIAALALFAQMIAGETLALESRFEFSRDPQTQAVLDSVVGAQRTTLTSGTYANTGLLVIDVVKSDGLSSGAVNV
jgi:isoleucyl-tRNA synthetase